MEKKIANQRVYECAYIFPNNLRARTFVRPTDFDCDQINWNEIKINPWLRNDSFNRRFL